MRDVTRESFATVGSKLLDGRFFTPADQASPTQLAIVNEPFAARRYQGRSPLGRYWYTIVGIAKAIREGDVMEAMRPVIYRLPDHCDQFGTLDTGIVVRTAVPPSLMVSAVRQAVWSIDNGQAIARVRTMDDITDCQLSTPTQSAASVGLYSVLSYAATQRANEIGVRMAPGATSRDILLTFGGRGLALTIGGLTVGLALAALAVRSMTALLYDFRPDFVATVAAVSAILLGMVAPACLIPAFRPPESTRASR